MSQKTLDLLRMAWPLLIQARAMIELANEFSDINCNEQYFKELSEINMDMVNVLDPINDIISLDYPQKIKDRLKRLEEYYKD